MKNEYKNIKIAFRNHMRKTTSFVLVSQTGSTVSTYEKNMLCCWRNERDEKVRWHFCEYITLFTDDGDAVAAAKYIFYELHIF